MTGLENQFSVFFESGCFTQVLLYPPQLWHLLGKTLEKITVTVRAYPILEFVVANILAKWKKLEPNEINFSQGFSQKVVSTSCFVYNSLPARGDFCCLLITFANNLNPDQARQNVGPDLDPNCL